MDNDLNDTGFAPYNRWLIAVVATIATFMEVLDTSIANVALPHIAGNLGVGVADSTWVLTSYLVSNAIVLPLSGWLSALLGRRTFYLSCVALFTLSSLLCGFAPNIETLVLCRFLQGLGGGGLQPCTQAILVDTFPLRQRGLGMAVYGMTVVAAPVIGPTLGGWITDNASWRWLFLLNVPVGIGSLLLASRYIVDPPHLLRRRGPDRFRIDFIGLGLMALAIGALQVGLDLGERLDWFASPVIRWTFFTCVFSGVAAVWWELRHPDPIIDLRLLGERNFALGNLTMLAFGFVMFGSTVLLPLFTQTLLGYSATTSGEVLSPGALAIMVLMPLIGVLVTRLDPRWMVIAGVMIVSGSLTMMAGFNTQVDFRTLVLARLVQGIGLAFIFVPLNTLAFASIPREQRSNASGIFSLARNLGASIGISLVATMLSRHAQAHQSVLAGHLSAADPQYQQTVTTMAHHFATQQADPVTAHMQAQAVVMRLLDSQARTLSFLDLFGFLAIGMLILVPLVLLMRRPRRS